MFFPWLTPLVAALALFSLAVFVGRRASDGELPQVFVFFAVVLCFWNLNFFALYSVEDKALLWPLSRTLRTGTLFLPPAILHLFLSIDPQRSRTWDKLLAVDYAIGAMLAVANGFDLLVLDLRHFEWGYASVGGVGYDLFTVFALVNAVAALLVLTYYYRTSREPRTRQQLAFWIAGSSFATPLVLTNLLPAYGVAIYPPGNLGSAVWAGVIGYAIVRHRLLDIELVVSKGLSYFIVALVVLVPFGLAIIGVQRFEFGSVNYNATLALFGVCVLASVSFVYLRSWVEERFESSLLREKREARESLVSFGKNAVRVFDEQELMTGLVKCTKEAFLLSVASVLTFAEREKAYKSVDLLGEGVGYLSISDSEVVDWIAGLSVPILKSEVASMERRSAVPSGALDLLEKNRWEVLVPLGAGGAPVGFLGLGAKQSAQPYSAGDLEVLETLSAQASIAVENARLQERLRKSREIIHRSDRLSALGTLAAGIAHEIRNPLVSIQTFFQLAPERLGDEEFMSSFLGLAEREVSRIRDLIGELLSYAKASEPSLTEVGLTDIVDRAVGLLMPHANEKKVDLAVEDLADLPIVEADADQLIQAVINIVLNAIDATEPGGRVRIQGAQQNFDKDEYAALIVEDTGKGIATELLEAIFDPFFTTKDEGTGLGLAISHRIVSDLGGFVTVSSTVGEGSRFVIGLPVADVATSARLRAAGGG
jgi:signal transduction histidine kinase